MTASPQPTSTTNPTDFDIATAGRLLRSGSFSARELTDAYLDRIDALDGDLGAYVDVLHDQARAAAETADRELATGIDRGPLHGMPIGVKEMIDTAGALTQGGSAIYRGRIPDVDATAVARLRQAGAVILGTTKTHELAFGITTTNPHFGPTRNPWDTARIPGGSSGGSAAAVAAGLAIAALGTDTGGSVRIPAALCGVVGVKATFGLVPTDGLLTMSTVADHVGVLARTVTDAATVLATIAGPSPADPSSLHVRLPALGRVQPRTLAGVRVGVARAAMWQLVEPDVATATQAALDLLAALGAIIVEVDLPDVMEVIGFPGSLGFFTFVLEQSRHAHRSAVATHPDGLGPDLAALYSLPPMTGPDVAEVFEMTRRYASLMRRAFDTVDLIASPTVGVTAPPIGADTVSVAGLDVPFIAVGLANTTPFNITGNPALSIPCGLDTRVLPVGLQLAGHHLADADLLAIAATFQDAAPRTWPTAPTGPLS